MKNKKTSALTIIILGGVITGTLSITQPPMAQAAELIDRVVASVNDEIITLSDLKHFKHKLETDGLTDPLLVPDEETKRLLINDPKRLLDALVDEKILNSQVKKLNLTATIERVEQEIRSITDKNGLTREQLKEAIRLKGIDFSEYQDYLKTSLEHHDLIQKEVVSTIKISEDDVTAEYLNRHANGAKQVFEYTLDHIVVHPSDSEKTESVLKLLMDKLVSGVEFNQVSDLMSENSGIEFGGRFGEFKFNELSKSMRDGLEKLGVGDFSKPIKIGPNYHIFKVTKMKAIPDPRTESERNQIRSELYQAAYNKQIKAWLEKLHEEVSIRINNQ